MIGYNHFEVSKFIWELQKIHDQMQNVSYKWEADPCLHSSTVEKVMFLQNFY